MHSPSIKRATTGAKLKQSRLSVILPSILSASSVQVPMETSLSVPFSKPKSLRSIDSGKVVVVMFGWFFVWLVDFFDWLGYFFILVWGFDLGWVGVFLFTLVWFGYFFGYIST